MKTYEVHLPVFKQGDDFDHFLKQAHGRPAAAFVELAEQYETASAICTRIAETLKKAGRCEAEGDAHLITITGDPKKLASLVADGVLSEVESEDEE